MEAPTSILQVQDLVAQFYVHRITVRMLLLGAKAGLVSFPEEQLYDLGVAEASLALTKDRVFRSEGTQTHFPSDW